MIPLANPLCNPRLQLWRPTEADRLDAVAIHADPRTYRFSPTGPMDGAAIDEMFDDWLSHWNTFGFGFWSIRAGDLEPIIGFGGVMYHDSTPERDDLVLYYRLRPAEWGRGYATEVAREAVRIAFDVVKVNRVVTKIREANIASIRVVEKLGFARGAPFEDGGTPSIRFHLSRTARSEPESRAATPS